MSEQRRLIIKGGHRLEGELAVQGAKNSVLPILAAAVLCKGQTELYNCPCLSDCDAACRILSSLGCACRREGNVICTDASALRSYEISEKLMREMRSSIIFMGALLGRTGQCRLSFPGGCEIGSRPIDFHLDAFRSMGVGITEKHGYLSCVCTRLKGAKISFPVPSVGATENVMLAAVLAEGTTEIYNAAREPEICDLAGFLNACGARISGAGTGTVHIEGVSRLSGCRYTVMPDRIAAATYLCCAAVTRGEVLLTKADPASLGLVVPVLEQTGCSIYSFGDGNIYINAHKTLRAPGRIRTAPYPGFPTDAQPPLMALCASVPGTTIFVETVFENRYRHVSELTRLGAKINVEGRVAVVEGVGHLTGAELEAGDLRGGAAMVTAALAAEGTTRIGKICYINRGYENIEGCLRSLGADIRTS